MAHTPLFNRFCRVEVRRRSSKDYSVWLTDCNPFSAFEVFLICYQFSHIEKSQNTTPSSAPDLSLASTTQNILNFIPGVTVSLFAFLLFGTTGPFRKRYMEAFQSIPVLLRIRGPTKKRSPHPQLEWDRLEALEEPQRYRIRNGRAESIEMANTESTAKAGLGIHVQQASEPTTPTSELPIQGPRLHHVVTTEEKP